MYSNLNLEVISDEEYTHVRKVCDIFKIRNLGEYHYLYAQSNTLMLADIFENFRNMCLNIYELDPVYFVSVPGLDYLFKKDRSKIRINNRL